VNDIVCGVDPSKTARRAAETAARLAAALGVNLHLVTVANRSGAIDVDVGGDHFHTDWLSEAAQFLDDVARSLPHDAITTTVTSGDPAKALCAEAERLGARMIVVGNRRVQGVSRLLGAVATDVARHATCDVHIANTVHPAPAS
jgi:nucleotide-binding universal stress UspA family protein